MAAVAFPTAGKHDIFIKLYWEDCFLLENGIKFDTRTLSEIYFKWMKI